MIAAAVAQFIFSGANSALTLGLAVLGTGDSSAIVVCSWRVPVLKPRLGWIVSYADGELHDPEVAPILVSLLQGSLMFGSFGASRYQYLARSRFANSQMQALAAPKTRECVFVVLLHQAVLLLVGLGTAADSGLVIVRWHVFPFVV